MYCLHLLGGTAGEKKKTGRVNTKKKKIIKPEGTVNVFHNSNPFTNQWI